MEEELPASKEQDKNVSMDAVAEEMFNYLRNVIYDPSNASLDIETLPESFQTLGKGLQFLATCVSEVMSLAKSMSKGDLNSAIPPSYNEIAAPLKTLHASLRHLTWQAQQIAKGDYRQRVDFMGEFSMAFNTMSLQLEERRQIETQERTKLQEYINLILSNSPSIILSFDTDGKAVFASESFSKKCKVFPAEEVQGKLFSELFSPISSVEVLKRMEDLFDLVQENKTTFVIEQELDFGQDGKESIYHIHASPMFYRNETFMGIMIIFDDITEIVRAREMAEQSARAKSEFLARMSHEMRTPMIAIMGMASIGKTTSDTNKKAHSFQEIEDAADHLLGLVNDILDISDIEANKLNLSFKAFRFRDMLCEVDKSISQHVAKKEQVFTTDVDENVPEFIISDEQRMAQVIINLLSNAVKFTPDRGTIAMTAKKIGEDDGICTIRVSVRDSGIGISKEQQKQLFIPFEQVDGSSSRKFGGSGLGLAISKNIVEKMDGDIWVESELGSGATFFFDIKARIGAEASAGESAEESEGLKADEKSDYESGMFSGKRILIAEDVDINREIISAFLEDTGAEISFAENGEDAVGQFVSDPDSFDLVLMDIQMPIMDGYEATRRIRSSGFSNAGSIPIVAMTANIYREDVERCLSAGMNKHLGKPVDINEVIGTLKEYLRPT